MYFFRRFFNKATIRIKFLLFFYEFSITCFLHWEKVYLFETAGYSAVFYYIELKLGDLKWIF